MQGDEEDTKRGSVLQEPAAGAGCVTSSPTFLQRDGLGVLEMWFISTN